MAKGDIPKKNSPQWVKNESIIAKTPMLRAARDQAEGFTPRGDRGATHLPSQAYKDNYDAIFGKKGEKDE
jgi:hypothetical protein